MKDIPTITLNKGAKIPVVGIGTWQMRNVEHAVYTALEAGYRHIDTAKIYGNEKEIGQVLKKTPYARNEIFVTTKLWPSDHGRERPLAAIDESLENLSLKYVDLYLVHWPSHSEKMRKDTWKAMEDIYKSKKAKAIGVSNYDIELLDELEGYAEILPAMNQIEVHPFWYRKELIDYCHEKKIAVTNYSPLMRKRDLDDPELQKISDTHEKTPAQILLRWGIQLGNIVIPKAETPEHIKEDIDIFDFELSDGEMQNLSALNQNISVV